MSGNASLQGHTGSLPGTLFSSAASQQALVSSDGALSAAQIALDSGNLDFDTCLHLLFAILQPSAPTYFNFGACPRLKEVACTLYPCSAQQEDLVRFLNALLLRFFPDKTWSCLWINFDCKKLPHRDSQNASGSENFTFSVGDFSGGGLWLHRSSTSAHTALVPPPSAIEGLPHVLGQVVDTNRRPFAFAASELHATMPWQGHRWLVAAYTC